MACGLPCVVVDNGGNGKCVSGTNSVKIASLSAKYVVNQRSDCLIARLSDRKLLKQNSQQTFADARKFSGVEKAGNWRGLAANSVPTTAKAPLIHSTLGGPVDREPLEKPRVANATSKNNKQG